MQCAVGKIKVGFMGFKKSERKWETLKKIRNEGLKIMVGKMRGLKEKERRPPEAAPL